MNTPRKMTVVAISAALASGMSVPAVQAQTTSGTASSGIEAPAPSITTATAAAPAIVATPTAPTKSEMAYLARVESRYATLSRTNLESLVHGLRTGTAITLAGTSGTAAASFTPPTRPMGYGNITRAVTLATRQLAAAGITNPTPQQLQTALMGGTLTTSRGTVTMQGVLQLRSQGMGWGRIAHTIGVQSGEGSRQASTTAAARASGGITTAGGSAGSRSAKTAHAPRTDTRGIVTAAGPSNTLASGGSRGAEARTQAGLVTAAGTAGRTGTMSGGRDGAGAHGHGGKH